MPQERRLLRHTVEHDFAPSWLCGERCDAILGRHRGDRADVAGVSWERQDAGLMGVSVKLSVCTL